MKLYSYDISSAYPYHASQLVDLRDCEFIRVDAHDFESMAGTLERTSLYGFLVGDFTVYHDHPLAYCSPFITDRGDGTPINFVGTAYDYPCLLEEVRTLYDYHMGEFKLKYGWFITQKRNVKPRYPLRDLMQKYYNERGNGQSALKSYLLKRVMNGVIGKLLETRKDNDGNITEYGELYNPIYHAICTTRTRLQVFDFIVEHKITQSELIFVGVDGVKTTRYIDLPEQAPMGEWRYAGSEPTIILSPGAILTLNRNFKRTGYAEMYAECLARPNARKYGVNGDIDLGKLFLNQNRDFGRLPSSGKSLLDNKYQSEPIEI